MLCVFTTTFVGVCNKSTQPTALNYIPTSCSRDIFLFLVTIINVATINGDISFGDNVAWQQDAGWKREKSIKTLNWSQPGPHLGVGWGRKASPR